MDKDTAQNYKEKRLQNVWDKYIGPAYTEYKKQDDDASKKVPNYFVPDIKNCDKNEVKYIILVESPHTDEVNPKIKTEERYPLAGDSGKSVAKFLFGEDNAIGELMKNKDEKIPQMAIVNVCNVPLQLVHEENNNDDKNTQKANNKNTQKAINNVKKYRDFDKDLNYVRNNCKVIDELKENLKERLKEYKKSNATIIVCGEFAKAYYYDIKNEKDFSNFKDLYVPHPSRNQWEFIYKHKDDVSILKWLFEKKA